MIDINPIWVIIAAPLLMALGVGIVAKMTEREQRAPQQASDYRGRAAVRKAWGLGCEHCGNTGKCCVCGSDHGSAA